MNASKNGYPAIPLITCDPYFSVWSMSDNLYDDHTRHWTGSQHSMTGIISVDGTSKTFMGRMRHNPLYNSFGPTPINQKSVEIMPLHTVYTFSDDAVELEVTFMTPLIPNDLKLMSRPVSYISYKIKSLDSKPHNCSIYIDVSALLAVNTPDESVAFNHTENTACCGRGEISMLKSSGDDHRINWGYLHIAAPCGKIGAANDWMKMAKFRDRADVHEELYSKEIKVSDSYPVLYYTNSYSVDSEGISDFMCIAYDDIHSLEYFNKPVDAYYKKDGESFSDVLKRAVEDYEIIDKQATAFEKDLMEKALKVSPDYAKLLSIAYRQSIAAHKLAWDGKEGIFVSKECFSNGCAATVDVTYPSIPLFLIYNPDLVEYMLNPIFNLIKKGNWPYKFAPHDAGTYPLVNGQVYGRVSGELCPEFQMPVEECGNMILCVAAICRAKQNAEYAKEHYDILKQWADYLTEFGFDPENQLCTDDFAGHLAHNCNLSVKAIMGIAAWGMIAEMLGNTEDATKYISTAKRLASKWREAAFEQDHYRLSFDRENSWSIKYNLVWDKLFGLNIFDEDIFTAETNFYMTKIDKYGLPLDCRSAYTKSDWQMWSTILCNNKEYTDKIISAMLKMLSETSDRVPFTDWYFTDDARQRGFQNRSVQGGLFIKLLSFR